MERSEIVLAAMASGGQRARFDPMQIQQLLFLADRELLGSVGTTGFGFRPSAYGPFDPDLRGALGDLAEQGRIVIAHGGPYVSYRVTESGRADGQAALERLGKRVSKHMAEAACWVLSQSFWGSIAQIHESYPEMTLDSKALEAAIPRSEPRTERSRHPILEGMAMALGFSWVFHEGNGPDPPSDDMQIAADWRAVGNDLRRAMELWALRPTRIS